jgi:spermidine synthase
VSGSSRRRSGAEASPRRGGIRLADAVPADGAGVTLSESQGLRYLHFGTPWIQGAMRIARPFALQLDYQRQMMAPLLFVPEPAKVIQLGLGAAALTKFVHRFVPSAAVTVVEVSTAVVAMAHRSFRLPPPDERLDVVVDDARAWIETAGRRARAQWLQVDLYDAAARGPVYDDVAFYSACRAALKGPAVMAVNLFGRSWRPSFAAIGAAFDGRVVVLPEADAGNRIALAFVGPPLAVPFHTLYDAARDIQDRLDLPARKWVSGLRVADCSVDGPVRIDADGFRV